MKNAVGERVNRSEKRPEDTSSAACPLRPVALFRSVGHMGLSASLPPHRRLRSILHRPSAVQPADADSNRRNSIGSWCGEGDPLPDIYTSRLNPQRSSYGRCSLRNNQTPDASTFTVWRRHSTGHSLPPRTHTGKRTEIFPQPQSHPEPSGMTTAPEGSANTGGKRWNRLANETQALGQSEASSRKDEKTDISGHFHNLVINADEKPKKRSSARKVSDDHVKEARQTRRDRRPHFLPPISHSGFLLDVPFALPENSPPPSPGRTSSPPSFPLHVPVPPLQLQHRHKDQ